MATSAAMVWEVMDGGSDLNGGGFKTGASGSNYAQQLAAQKSGTDLTMHASVNTKCHPIAAGVAAGDVGNTIYIASGTSWTPGWYEITAQDGTDWTLDRSPSADANANAATYKMGGALGSPGCLSSTITVSGQKAWVQQGTYTLTTTTAGSGGPVSITAGLTCVIEGWASTRGDLGTKPIVNAGTQTGITMFTMGSSGGQASAIVNITADGNCTAADGKSVDGFVGNINGRPSYWFCKAINCNSAVTNYGFATVRCVGCIAEACGLGFKDTSCTACTALSCTSHGFSLAQMGYAAVDCVSYGNAGDGFLSGQTGHVYVNCTAYDNDGDGFDGGAATGHSFVNCYAGGNGAYGFNTIGTSVLINCASYNNTSGRSPAGTDALREIGAIAITDGEPLTAPGTDDFEPNVTASRGALLMAGGIGATGQTHGRGVGAVQRRYPTLPAVANVWNTADDYGYAGALQDCSADGMHASDIANCEEGNVKKDVTIDDVTGTYEGAGGGGAIVNQGLHAIESGICA